ncbi:hypothetical protein BASA60_003906 [Batrachochytrium salamandrivorans]|nr:hypothetical protein BASA60_003906 [Batrachochytrium salamandrivorans]
MLVSSIVALLATASTFASAETYDAYNLLKDDRAAGRLVFLPMNPSQKEIIVKNSENVLTAWVNYDSKIANYGPDADPFPIIKSLRKNIDTISDNDLQLGLTDAFVKIRDLHTRWINAPPYRCFFATTGLTFGFIEGSADIAKKPTVVVTDITSVPKVLALFGKDYSKIQLGDELHTVDGLSFADWFKKNQFKSGAGANDFGGQRRALSYLTTIRGAVNRLPTEDFVTFQFKSRAHYKRVYTVKVPYVAGHSASCWALGSNLYKKISNITLPGTPPPLNSFKKQSDSTEFQRQLRALKERKNPSAQNSDSIEAAAIQKLLFSDADSAAIVMKPTAVTSIFWSIYQPNGKNMGVIRLSDFQPKDPSTQTEAVERGVMIIRNLLTNEMKDTKSVIFELRGNPGGYISFANSMPQLFKPDFIPYGARYLMNNVTHNTFVVNQDPADPWAKVWGETKPGSRYTNIAPFDSFESSNTLGQAYLRPMGIFNDGVCFSACDMFSGNIQGHRAGTIFGEEGQTGAGGANILSLDDYLSVYNKYDFKPFPYTKELTYAPEGGKFYNRLSVGIRQSVRNGIYDGQLIEDTGIKSDIIVRARWSDLMPNSTTNTQYDRIADNLARIGEKTGQNSLHFIAEPFNIVTSGNEYKIGADIAGIDQITVFKADGVTEIFTQSVPANSRKIVITSPPVINTLGNSHITIVGKSKGKQVLKTYRSVRAIPTTADRIDITRAPFVLSTVGNAVGVYNSGTTSSASGWNLANGKWIIGNGIKYIDNADTTIEAFLTAPVGTRINVNLNLALDSERDYDFVYLNIRSDKGVEDFLLSSKGLDNTTTFPGESGNKTVNGVFPFTTKSTEFSVALRFTSDGGSTLSGATVNTLSVTTN